jgi:hypothetical protein
MGSGEERATPSVDPALQLLMNRRFPFSLESLMPFQDGDRVLYIPGHAQGDPNHEDCEMGHVTRSTDKFVFVRFGPNRYPQACDAANLVKLPRLELQWLHE